jgi:hypothetical protein
MQDSELPAAAAADFDFPDFIAKLIFSLPKSVAQRVLNIGKTKLHDLLGERKLDAVKNGPHTEITVESIRRYRASLPPATFKPPPKPRMESLDKLHAKQRQLAAQRRAQRAERRRSKARGE